MYVCVVDLITVDYVHSCIAIPLITEKQFGNDRTFWQRGLKKIFIFKRNGPW